jgi:hypothetical protein
MNERLCYGDGWSISARGEENLRRFVGEKKKGNEVHSHVTREGSEVCESRSLSMFNWMFEQWMIGSLAEWEAFMMINWWRHSWECRKLKVVKRRLERRLKDCWKIEYVSLKLLRFLCKSINFQLFNSEVHQVSLIWLVGDQTSDEFHHSFCLFSPQLLWKMMRASATSSFIYRCLHLNRESQVLTPYIIIWWIKRQQRFTSSSSPLFYSPTCFLLLCLSAHTATEKFPPKKTYFYCKRFCLFSYKHEIFFDREHFSDQLEFR